MSASSWARRGAISSMAFDVGSAAQGWEMGSTERQKTQSLVGVAILISARCRVVVVWICSFVLKVR